MFHDEKRRDDPHNIKKGEELLREYFEVDANKYGLFATEIMRCNDNEWQVNVSNDMFDDIKAVLIDKGINVA